METVKLCPEICRKCNRCIGIQLYDVDTSRFLFEGQTRKPKSIHKCVRLSCCNVVRNSISNELFGFSQYNLKEWDFDYGQFNEANRLYNLFRRYSRRNAYKIECLDFSKLDNATDEVKELLSGVMIGEWQCPYFAEHQFFDWNTK